MPFHKHKKLMRKIPQMGYVIFQEAYQVPRLKICCLRTAFPACYFLFQSAHHNNKEHFSKLEIKHLTQVEPTKLFH